MEQNLITSLDLWDQKIIALQNSLKDPSTYPRSHLDKSKLLGLGRTVPSSSKHIDNSSGEPIRADLVR